MDPAIVESTVVMLGNGAKNNNYQSNENLGAYKQQNHLAASGPVGSNAPGQLGSNSKNKYGVMNKQSQLLQGVLSQQRRFSRIISSTSKTNQNSRVVQNLAKKPIRSGHNVSMEGESGSGVVLHLEHDHTQDTAEVEATAEGGDVLDLRDDDAGKDSGKLPMILQRRAYAPACQ